MLKQYATTITGRPTKPGTIEDPVDAGRCRAQQSGETPITIM